MNNVVSKLKKLKMAAMIDPRTLNDIASEDHGIVDIKLP
jgi:hypothetical protein